DEEHLITASRPILLNGIAPEMVSRPDLLDRSLLVELPAIPDDRRRTREEVWAGLVAARPALLGALLDAVSTGLRRRPEVRLAKKPRLADFAVWAEACGPALGWREGEVVNFLLSERSSQESQALATWSVMPVLTQVLRKDQVFEGTVASLLQRL